MSTPITETPATLYNNGDTAWVLTSGILVILMTFGLALFYASLTHKHRVESTLLQTCITLGLVSIQWVLFGYSFAFAVDGSTFFGTFEWAGLKGFSAWSSEILDREVYQGTIPGVVFCFFQLTFAIITPSIFAGAVVGKMNFFSFLVFVSMWTTIVYDTVAHWEWSLNGWLHNLGSLDFAGGSVVHISSGFTALAMSIVLNLNRIRFPFSIPYILPKKEEEEKEKMTDGGEVEKEEHLFQAAEVDAALNLLGGGLLWVGWFGFNGGSALSASHVAGIAVLNTQLCAGSSMFFWAVIELIITKIRYKKATISLDGPLYGAVCGLVVITPGCGYIEPGYSILIGCYTAFISFAVLVIWKKIVRRINIFDDSVYVFVSHGVGGMIGSFTTGLFASLNINPGGANGAFYGGGSQVPKQLAEMAAIASWSFFVSLILMLILKFTIGVNEIPAKEEDDIDLADPGDNGKKRKFKRQNTLSELTD